MFDLEDLADCSPKWLYYFIPPAVFASFDLSMFFLSLVVYLFVYIILVGMK